MKQKNSEKIFKKVVLLVICVAMLCSILNFTQAAGTTTLTVSNSTIPLNGAVDVAISNAQSPTSQTDWVGLYEDNVTPGGSQPSIWWDYILNQGVTDGNGTFTFDPANIPSAQKSRYVAGKKYKFILAYNSTYTVSASVSFNVSSSQSPTIKSINPVIVTTSKGTAPSLPSTVTAVNSDASQSPVSVTWNSIDPSLYSQVGSFTVKGVVASTGVVPKASVTVIEGSGPVLSFDVISDTHINNSSSTDIYNQHLTAALTDMSQVNPNANALIVDGDITDGGNASQYDTFNSILNSIPHATPYFSLGNHDTWQSDYNTAKNNFLTKTGMSSVYYDKYINGYHFIVLGSEALDGNVAVISTTQLNWFQQKLGENASPNKPIFVFLHQPLSNTVSGSDKMQDVQQDAQIKTILAQYPQAMLITGHTHSVLTESTEFCTQQCNMVNTASTAYLWYDPTYTQPGTGSQGLYFDVYPDKVVVKCREFTRQEWIAQKTFMYSGTQTPTPTPTGATATPTPTPTPTSQASISTNKGNYAVGESITVNFSNGPGNPKDWIGIYKSTDTPGVQNSTKWLYVNGTQTATTGISTGSVTFTGGLASAGSYKVGFFLNDGYTTICNYVNITVQ